jgi:hypothetical protein
MKRGGLYYIAVISHKRPENVARMQEMTGGCTFFVNKGEHQSYIDAGAKNVVECGDNICQARNEAVRKAGKLYCIQISDDLKRIKKVSIVKGKKVQKDYPIHGVCMDLCDQLINQDANFAGVAVTSNALNYDGTDVSLDKLIVNDFICLAPKTYFNESLYLKEDYGLTIEELIHGRPVVRLNYILWEFPHRQNKGGANTYRNSKSEKAATERLKKVYGKYLKDNPRRPGQVLLNYKVIRSTIVKDGYAFS